MNTEIRILGKSYAVRSEVDNHFMEETASLVDQKMRELVSKAGSFSTERIAVLAAMNFAGQLLREQSSANRDREEFRRKIKKIMDQIDGSL